MPTSIEEATLLAACAIACAAIVLLAVAWRLSRHSKQAPAAPTTRDSSAELDRGQAELRELMSGMEQLAGRVDARIEARLQELADALAEAETKVATIQSLLEHDGAALGEAEASGDYVSQPSPEEEAAAEAATDAPKKKSRTTAGGALPLNPRQQQILRLHGQGLTAVEIARQLHLPAGEVELVLNLSLARQGL